MAENELPVGEAGEGRPRSSDPFADLTELFAKVDPEKPNQSFQQVVCRICGVPSGWAAIWEPGGNGAKALSDFREGHRKATQGSGPFGAVGHNKWHEFNINRSLL
ncbi:hypothetical protein [Streptomyces sp. NPDC057002]|uniref:hypothetical protein n=1 Tax=Streptomyces sp. NPDC057002 TaxID=3345992 RepID=UPI003636C535